MKTFSLKSLVLLVASLAWANHLASQTCATSTDTAHLDVNNARVILQASGDFFWDRQHAGYFVPKNDPSLPQTAVIFAGGLWLGGFAPDGNLKTAIQTYGASNDDAEWWPGPLSLDGGVTNIGRCGEFDKLWKINRSDINSHIADFNDNGSIQGPVPISVLAWPGRNSTHSVWANGFMLPEDQPLAPFVDRDGDGNYEPLLGDYPDVPGDQAIWWVFNDEGGGAFHGESNSVAIRAEVHAMAYAYEGTDDETLANTTFYNFTIYNRALEFIDSTYVSLWLDADVGYSSDDYFGCISAERTAFFYNADGEDGQPNCEGENGVPTFCEDPPIIAMKVLNGSNGQSGSDVGFSSLMYSFGAFDPPVGMTNPSTDVEFYRNMTGSWRDGTPISFGSNGYDNSNMLPYYPYVMDGNPADTSAWSFCTDVSIPTDYRILINSGPFHLEPGESTSVCYAIMTKFGLELPCPDVTPLLEMGDAVEAYCANISPSSDAFAPASATQFYPNPLSTEGKLVVNGALLESVRLLNLDGRVVREYSDLKTNELALERGDLPSGFYLYAALLNNGQWSVGKIVVR